MDTFAGPLMTRLGVLVITPPLVLLTAGMMRAAAPVERQMARATGEWTQLAPVPQSRTEVSVTTDGRTIYLIGGFGVPQNGEPTAPREMFAYDSETDRWSTAGRIPEGVNHAGFLYHDGRLYLVGGYVENTFEPTGAVRIYDIEGGRWRDGAPMPTPRGALAYAVLNGKIHTIGGTVAPPEPLDDHDHEGGRVDHSVGTHEVYDPATDTWDQRAAMPTARNHHVAAAVDGRIYVTAGRFSTNFTMTTTEVYDPSTDRWTEAPPLPTGRSGVAGAVFDGWMYVFGGETFDPGAERTFDAAERFSPRERRWEKLPPMPTARHGLGAAPVGSAIYVVSGGPEPGFSFGTANERFVPHHIREVEPTGPEAPQARERRPEVYR
jgi:hypothetical protein